MVLARPLLGALAVLLSATCGRCSLEGLGFGGDGEGEGRPVTITGAGPSGPTTPTPPHEWPPGVPPRNSCSVDDDCMVVADAPGADPCCDETVTAEPISRRYLLWVAAFRARECGGVQCPPQMIPGAQLAECGYEGRCVAGQCTNACGQPESP